MTDGGSADGEWQPVASGLAFPEGIRWHDGTLWLSDVFACQILQIEQDGSVRVVAHVPGRPSGLGWRPDGTLLAVSMSDRQLLAVREARVADDHQSAGAPQRTGDAQLDVVSELRSLTGGDCNDMLVDGSGRAYIGNFGYDYAAGHQRQSTPLVLVDLDGQARHVAEDLWFPNGMALSPDGRTLHVAETPAERISSFSVAADGSLSDRRVMELDGLRPDGMALDAEGALWVASPGTGELARVGANGQILERQAAPGGVVQACALGGPDGDVLFVCGSPTHDEAEALEGRAGRILARRVAVPAAAAPLPRLA